MIKKTLLFFLFTSFLFASVSWDGQQVFRLKKDEFGKIIFHERGKEGSDFTYIFKFRWTLYDSQKVILLSNYRDFPRQHSLKFEFRQNTIEQVLLDRAVKNRPKDHYLLLQMDSYDKKKKEIVFLVFIKDSDKKFEIKYIHPKRLKKDAR